MDEEVDNDLDISRETTMSSKANAQSESDTNRRFSGHKAFICSSVCRLLSPNTPGPQRQQ